MTDAAGRDGDCQVDEDEFPWIMRKTSPPSKQDVSAEARFNERIGRTCTTAAFGEQPATQELPHFAKLRRPTVGRKRGPGAGGAALRQGAVP